MSTKARPINHTNVWPSRNGISPLPRVLSDDELKLDEYSKLMDGLDAYVKHKKSQRISPGDFDTPFVIRQLEEFLELRRAPAPDAVDELLNTLYNILSTTINADTGLLTFSTIAPNYHDYDNYVINQINMLLSMTPAPATTAAGGATTAAGGGTTAAGGATTAAGGATTVAGGATTAAGGATTAAGGATTAAGGGTMAAGGATTAAGGATTAAGGGTTAAGGGTTAAGGGTTAAATTVASTTPAAPTTTAVPAIVLSDRTKRPTKYPKKGYCKNPPTASP